MPNNSTVDSIAFVSAIVGVISAFLAFLSYRLTKRQGSNNSYNSTVEKCRNNLDRSYLSTSKFINEFSEKKESKEKRISREQIMYLLELLRKEFPTETTSEEFTNSYENLIVLISDISYESNIEKIFRDLAKIKSQIAYLKENLAYKE